MDFRNKRSDQRRTTGSPPSVKKLSAMDLPSLLSKKDGFSKYRIYKTLNDGKFVPPLSIYRTIVKDEGNCNPEFLRPTFYFLPKTRSLLKQTGIPFGCVCNSLSRTAEYDEPKNVHRVDYSSSNKNIQEPVRCNRCRCYVNPFVRFIENGRFFGCNFCGFENEVPSWYYDGFGNMSLSQRPELRYGSVEYVVRSEDYQFRKPVPLTYIFVVDVSKESKRQGLFHGVLNCLKNILGGMKEAGAKCRIGIVTFAKSIQFYNFKKGGASVMIVGDLENPFLPFPPNSLISVEEFYENQDEYFEHILETGKSIQETGNAGGSAIEFSSKFLDETGGKVIFFSTRYPNVGKGSSAARNHMSLYGHKGQGKLFVSVLKFWDKLASTFPQKAISIDMFLFPDNYSTFMESGMMSTVCQQTNGHLYVYTKYNFSLDLDRFQEDISKTCLRTTGYDGIFRVRCSQGFDVKSYHGFFKERKGSGEIDIANVDEDSSVVVEFEHDDTIEGGFSFIQSALLYTTRKGERVVRIHTLRLPVADTLGKAFKFTSIETVANYWGKYYAVSSLRNRIELKDVREILYNNCVEVLSKYRKHAVKGSSDTRQLVLPESLKYYPLFILSLNKSSAFQEGSRIHIDQRIRYLFNLVKMKQRYFNYYIYPRLYPLHTMKVNVDEYLEKVEGEDEMQINKRRKELESKIYRNPFPYRTNLSAAYVDSVGIYLLDDGMEGILYVGKNCSRTLLLTLFGTDDLKQVTSNVRLNLNRESFVGRRISWIVNTLRKDRHQCGSSLIFREIDPYKHYFFGKLVEDRNVDDSYLQFVCNVHQEILNKISY